MTSRVRYIIVETLISVAANTILSICFVFLAFHGQSTVQVAGRHGLVIDMVPQTFMVVLMSCLVPGLVTRRRLSAGTVSWHPRESKLAISDVFRMAVVLAILGSIVVVGLCWIALPHLLPQGVAFGSLLIGKALFGLLLAAIVTPWAIGRVLR